MNLDQIKSTAIPILTAASAVALALNVLTPDQVATVQSGLADMWQGALLMYKGVTAIAVVALPTWAWIRRSRGSVAASTQASATEQVVTSDPKVAAAAPGAILGAPGSQVTVTVPAAPKPA